MKTDIKEISKRIAQATAELNMKKDTNDITLDETKFIDYFKHNFGYKDIIHFDNNPIKSIEVTRGILATNFNSDENIEQAKKLCYEYLKEKNTNLNYNDIVKISITSIEFDINKPIEYFLVALLKNNKSISMKWHLEDYQINQISYYIPNIFNLIKKDEDEKRLGFKINKAININYKTNLISFVDINIIDNFINHKKNDYKKLEKIIICGEKPDYDWHDLDQKKYWWCLCHKSKTNNDWPIELAEKFWGTYFVMVDDYGLYLVWINIENDKYNLVEINGITNNEIPESLIRKVDETLEKENEKIQKH